MVTLAAGRRTDSGHVRATSRFGHGQAADQLAGERWSDVRLDEVGLAAGFDMRQRDAMRIEGGDETGRPTGENDLLDHGRRVENVAARPADRHWMADPQQPQRCRFLVQITRDLAHILPCGQIRHYLPYRELVGKLAKRGHRSASGMSTWRDRSHSPSAFACGSNRVEAATPRPSSPWMTKFSACRLGSS